jgi:ATP-dependent protease ClpP protease subunit
MTMTMIKATIRKNPSAQTFLSLEDNVQMDRNLVLGTITDFAAASFSVQSDDRKNTGRPLVVDINSGGGDVYAGFQIITKLRSFPNEKQMNVVGKAMSMGAFMLTYADNVKAIPEAAFMLHRASFAFEGFIELNEFEKEFLTKANKDLRAQLEQKIDVAKFEAKMSEVIPKADMDRFFDISQPPIDVLFDSEFALEIGLIAEITTFEPEALEEIENRIAAFSKTKKSDIFKPETADEPQSSKNKKKSMTLEDLKKEHPELVSSLIKEGFENGVKSEKDRVAAWSAYSEIDPEAVAQGIASGEEVTQKVMSEMQVAAMKNNFIKGADGGDDDDLGDDDDSDEEGADDAIEASKNQVLENAKKKFLADQNAK